MSAETSPGVARHVPVLLGPVMEALSPGDGDVMVDATFGAGGYTRAILDVADTTVIALDRDPQAIAAGAALAEQYGERLLLIEGRFSRVQELVGRAGHERVDGVVLDAGVSSMQLDEAVRGFSFMRDGPLDMRMEQAGRTAADVVNTLDERDLRQIIAVLGEEKRAHAIARAIARRRSEAPFVRTGELAELIEAVIGRPPRGRGTSIHPATRTFQALRIYVNCELRELAQALAAAERMLSHGGRMAVVTFHSLEDRIVKRFLRVRTGRAPRPSRHQLQAKPEPEASFEPLTRGSVTAGDEEVAANPRARSARLRAARRTGAPAHPFSLEDFGKEVELCCG